ncbi:N-acetyl-alpha-D-glucosaminyl L-malate synthase BshA [bacterium CG10_46_32]|nr:MAG: N-acetyl-alpha-D-glucosaminyl L-malate synthase BshA [bacterium CG10_46_32]PIR56031.1 MAG: N-acetyl-alpha-D-glucosaminyl L-malate synthase BshA [Parcubacteria group bacterium CG10_big_fil_rev_8_21_14_0_10_46_32]
MKIGIVCYPSYGGSGGFATSLAQELAKRNHEIHIISYDLPFNLSKDWPKNLHFHKVDVTDYPVFKESPYTIALTNKLAEVIQEERLDIVHAHYAMPHAVALSMARKMVRRKIKTITTLHGTDATIMGKDQNLGNTLEFAIKDSDAITTVSESLAKEAKKNYNLKTTPHVIYNFVTTYKKSRITLRGLRKIFADPNEKILIHVSNFRPVKRIRDVIAVFDGVQKKIPAKLLLVGDGPDLIKAKQAARRKKIAGKVHFLGFQLDIAKLLSISDLFLLTSENEGFNLSALEAISCGVPIIGSNTVGMSEMVTDNKAGVLSRVGNTKHMIKNAIELLENKDKWLAYSINGMNAVKNKYRPEIIVPQYEELYKKVLKAK